MPACKSKKVAEDNNVYDFAEVMPVFIGGPEEMQKFILNNITYPPIAIENKTVGTVKVSFIVEKDGTVTDVKTVNKEFGDGLEQESMRVVKMMKFSPGKNNGKIVRVKMMIPIKFRLT